MMMQRGNLWWFCLTLFDTTLYEARDSQPTHPTKNNVIGEKRHAGGVSQVDKNSHINLKVDGM